MEYRRLGDSDLMVSRICLGCLSFGEPTRGGHQWTLDEARSRPIIRHAIDSGINFFDTANIYSAGSSEEILGKLLKEHVSRQDVIVATKVHGRMGPGPEDGGLSRGAIVKQVDASLKRLGTDYIDLYQIHRLDLEVPIEETLEALNDLVMSGKVRYIGASSMYAWQFVKMLHVSQQHGWTRFISMQNHLNLIYREEQREMLPLCIAENVAVIPWSPLARGQLARPVGAVTERSRGDAYTSHLYDASKGADDRVITAVEAVASGRGAPMAQVALSWLLGVKGVVSPLIGVTKDSQIDDAVAAVGLKLGHDEVALLEASYEPHVVTGIT